MDVFDKLSAAMNASRKEIIVGWIASAMLSAAAFFALPSSAETILSKADLRIWETVCDRADPLSWPWEHGADSAKLTFSNRVTHAVWVDSVARSVEMRGSCEHPVTAAREETIVDVTLVQMAGGREVSRETATLAYVCGAGGGPMTVRASESREWRRFYEPRVYAVDFGYDIAWPVYMGLGIILR